MSTMDTESDCDEVSTEVTARAGSEMSFESYAAFIAARARTDVTYDIEYYGAPVVDRDATTVRCGAASA